VAGKTLRPALIVSLLGDRELGRSLGKPTTRSDLTLYDAIEGDKAITYVEPTHFPEKLFPLLAALAMGSHSIFSIQSLTRDIGETALAIAMSGTRHGALVLGSGVGLPEVSPVLREAGVPPWPAWPADPLRIRQEVASWPPSAGVWHDTGPVRIPVDHAFPVRGVGTVVLGIVRGSSVRAHDRLRLYPTELKVEIRSLQVHDEDQSEVPPGHRVGAALKGVESTQIERGYVLAPEGALECRSQVALENFARCPFFRSPLGVGSRVHVASGLQIVPARLTRCEGTRWEVQTDRPLAFQPGDRGLLAELSGGGSGPRLVGSGTLA
jgi:selenocysteine-specific translation elongation factor